MLLDFIATVSAGLGLAGLALILRSLLRGRAPSWLVPAAAGLGMLGFAIWNEYTWFSRTAATLPPGVIVARTVESRAPWRPWTYLRPIVTRFIAVDTRAPRTAPEALGQGIVPVLFVARWQGTESVPVLFDCPGARRLPLTGEAPIPSPGDPSTPWEQVSPDDEVLRAACTAL
ncbi:hypothetical protein [Rubellimicrobium sp. CFH 75288]|uniref:hypothetical protein n=1 Tax=Rubellimicrobium sp. CFH 75288 TaxID=2697034 RepID=UPI0014131746|nr:hypothetical protein [Rubellimicrobium sp. CFH 75288]NAZ36179.1 hypothetical protein [Rubellimicrobium sp. CFH 75288]